MTLLAALLVVPPSSRAIALTYHDITPKKQVWFDCTPSEFESQLSSLKKQGANFIAAPTLEDFLLHDRKLPPHAVLITFADNYEGFYRYALPYLIKNRIPSIMFVHTGFVGSKVGRPKMTWTQLVDCAQKGVVIGSQTVTHRSVDTLALTETEREFKQSLRHIRSHITTVAAYLAYPNGAYNDQAIFLAKQAGYRLAFAETQTPITSKTDPYAIPRYVHTKWKTAWNAIR